MKASVIIRSYNRVHVLLELLEKLKLQSYSDFEIVIVEQSTIYKQEDWVRLEAICSANSSIKLLKYKPLGGPKARNEGVLNATGEIIILLDDDDYPLKNDWIARHVDVYSDSSLIGFTGRHIFEGNTDCPYVPWMRWFIRLKCMQYNWLKFPYTFAQYDEDVVNVKWLHGTNSSIRRDWALKAGLWDTNVKNQDEHSFAFKLQPLLKYKYRIDFRKSPAIIRRMDVKGGMGKRNFSFFREWENQFSYVKNIVYKYFPLQKLLLPLHLVFVSYKSIVRAIKN